MRLLVGTRLQHLATAAATRTQTRILPTRRQKHMTPLCNLSESLVRLPSALLFITTLHTLKNADPAH
jgi:hypothetical protein